MNQNLTSYLYIGVGLIALFLSSHLLLQLMTMLFAVYCLYKGFSMRHPQPNIIVFMRTMYSRFFGRF